MKTLAIALIALSLVTTSVTHRGSTKAFPSNRFEKLTSPLPNFDIRLSQEVSRVSSPTRSQLAAFARLRRSVGSDLRISFNRVTGTPRHLFSLTSFLTSASGDNRREIALDFLRENSDLFKLSSEEIHTLRVVKNYVTKHNGVTHLAFQQQYGGIEVFQSDLRVNISSDGRIISVNGQYFPGLTVSLEPKLTAAEAVLCAVKEAFPDLAFSPVVKKPARGRDQSITFHRGDFTDDVTARLTIFPAHDRARLGWRVRLHAADRLAWYDTVIDAESGELLYRYNLYVFDQPEGLVFDLNPDVGPQVLRSFTGDPIASPVTWVSPPPNTRTIGNNAMVVPSPVNAEQQFRFPFLNAYEQTGMNSFDLDGKNIRLTPNAAGGYDLSFVPLSFDSSLGTNLTPSLVPNRDDGSVLFNLGFSFPFFGTNYNALSINANGNVTFTGPSSLSTESAESLALGLPRIAAFWDDLDFTRSGGLFAKIVGTPVAKVVITWNAVPEWGTTNSNTIQLTLSNDGAIKIAYNGVSATDGLVGVSRGMGEVAVRQVDITASAPLTGLREGVFEKFPAVELEAAATNLFYHLNFMHDYLYKLGFDEAAGNFQTNNFGRGGLGNDPVIGFPQATGTNNANFGASEDGFPPRTRYFFFTSPPFRQADADFDADVIYHEYVHGLTLRLVGGPQNVAVLSGVQSGALGEGWSDAFSTSITNDPITGEYSTGNRETGVRRVAYDKSPLKYGDFGNSYSLSLSGGATVGMGPIFYTQVHRDGEIWASVLWDLRVALGKEKYEQLITDGLKFTPPNPSMLEARDAILLADKVNTGGANMQAIWTVFAARGMGFSAKSVDGSDNLVFEAFDTPSDPLPPVKDVLFFDSMESGVGGWEVTPSMGLWHQSSRRSASGSTAWYYGQEFIGSINTGSSSNFGALTSPSITLPTIAGNSAIVLEFDHLMRRSESRLPYDCGFVRIIDAASGGMIQKAFILSSTLTPSPSVESVFEHREINISEFAGRTIQVQFYFDTLDGLNNTGEGWYIDNVRVSLRAR